jgi:outer membrane lipoprotein-sorting protein
MPDWSRAIVPVAKLKKYLLSEYGTNYVIDGIILTPTDDAVSIRTVWVVKNSGAIPKFVTAYPLRLRR